MGTYTHLTSEERGLIMAERLRGSNGVRFRSSAGVPVELQFTGVAAFSWAEANDELLRDERSEGIYEVIGSLLLSNHKEGKTYHSVAGLRHVRLNFNTSGRLRSRPNKPLHAAYEKHMREAAFRMQSSNDDYFDLKAQLLTLTEEQALEYAKNFIDQNFESSDAAYLTEVIAAGEKSAEVTYQHAVSGSPVAQLVYGVAKLNGSHMDQNVSEGLFWLIRSFNNGNAKAAIMLAGAYMAGKHVPESPQRAFRFASFAADQGLPAGQFILANLLVGGEGIPEDHEYAIELLRAAAKTGYAPALQMLEENEIPLE